MNIAERIFKNLAIQAPVLGKVFAKDTRLGKIPLAKNCLNPRTSTLLIKTDRMSIRAFTDLHNAGDAFHKLYINTKNQIEDAVIKEVGDGAAVADSVEELYGLTSLHRNGDSFHFETIVTLIINEPCHQ